MPPMTKMAPWSSPSPMRPSWRTISRPTWPDGRYRRPSTASSNPTCVPGGSSLAGPSIWCAATTEAEAKTEGWQDEVYTLLRRHNMTQFAYVPDAGHKILINRALADPDVHAVALTTEEEGVALLAGADLGGERGVLLMQSSGAGNCVNMLSLMKGGRFPLLTLVSMRGDFGEGIPWQYPMGQAVHQVLQAREVIYLPE